jgi:hypothetical protein
MNTRHGAWTVLVLLGVSLAVSLLPVASPPAAQPAPAGEIDPRAAELLKRMSDYLAGLKEFTVRARHTSVTTGSATSSSDGRTSCARTGSVRWLTSSSTTTGPA